MAIHRVVLRKMVGEKPDPRNDPVISSDYSIPLGSYSFLLNMKEAGKFNYYTVSYDDAGNISAVSSVVTVTVEKK